MVFAIQKANLVDIQLADFGDIALCLKERKVVSLSNLFMCLFFKN